MEQLKEAVFLKHYEAMIKWASRYGGLPEEEALCLVHSFFLHWKKAKIEDKNLKLDALLWHSFRNNVKTNSKLFLNKFFFEELTEQNGGLDLSPADIVLPRVSFEQFYKSLNNTKRKKVDALLLLEDSKLVDAYLGTCSIRTYKHSILAPLFWSYFIGKEI
jgi:hypothetical protein